jgi:hypothetical protein
MIELIAMLWLLAKLVSLSVVISTQLVKGKTLVGTMETLKETEFPAVKGSKLMVAGAAGVKPTLAAVRVTRPEEVRLVALILRLAPRPLL